MRTKTNYRKRTMKPFITLSAIVLTVSSLMVTAQQESFNDESNQSDFVEDHSGHAHGSHHDESDHNESDHNESGHNESGHSESGHSDEAGIIELNSDAMKIAGIEVNTLTFQKLPAMISAPGEIILDQYASADVTPLIDAVVVKRHAKLGDEVSAGQVLVTLASVEVAEAQGDYRLAVTEWNRVKKLGQSTIGAQRYTKSQVAFEQARLTLSAYGLDDKQIQALGGRDLSGSLGQFDLVAPLAGTVLLDSFRLGERVEAGRQLFLITDEARVWVQANLSPVQAKGIEVGSVARVNLGSHWHNGKVIQKHHMLDEHTRTIPVRIAIDSGDEHHHAGEFVQVAIAVDTKNPEVKTSTFVVTESALMQDDEGVWTVFLQVEEGHFRQVPVTRGASRGGQVVISGIEEGSLVVTSGAFFLAAELAKSGFDIHNH